MSHRRPYGLDSSSPWSTNNSTYSTTYGSSYRNFNLGNDFSTTNSINGKLPSFGLRGGRYLPDEKPLTSSSNSSTPWNPKSSSSILFNERSIPHHTLSSSGNDRFNSSNTTLLTSTGSSSLSSSSSGGYMNFRDIFSQISSITPHVYLCSVHALDSSRLRSLGISLVVSAIAESPPSFPGVAETMHVPVEDVEYANISIYFDRVADRIHSEELKGRRTVVHCMAGISRSTSLVLAYLMKHQNMTLRQAFNHVRTRRSCIQPNPGFWRQLVAYEEKLYGSRSVRMVNTGAGVSHPDLLTKAPVYSSSSTTTGGVANRRPQFGLFYNRL